MGFSHSYTMNMQIFFIYLTWAKAGKLHGILFCFYKEMSLFSWIYMYLFGGVFLVCFFLIMIDNLEMIGPKKIFFEP